VDGKTKKKKKKKKPVSCVLPIWAKMVGLGLLVKKSSTTGSGSKKKR
jgi:hypothetical protein